MISSNYELFYDNKVWTSQKKMVTLKLITLHVDVQLVECWAFAKIM